MCKPAGGNTQISFGAWLPILNPRAISVGISCSFSMWNIVMYLAEFCICVPLIPKYVVYIIIARQYQHDYIISLIPKIYITFLPYSLNLNPSVNLCKDQVVS